MATMALVLRCYFHRSLTFPLHCSRAFNFIVRTNSLRSGKPPNDEGPIQYRLSKAAKWKAANTRQGSQDVIGPWYQPIVVSLSIGVFLLYFCVFREENDIDIELGRSLYDRIEGLEETQLKLSLKYNEEHGLDTSAIKARLHDLEEEKKGI